TSCTANGLADGEWEWVVNTKTSTCTPGVDSGKRAFSLGCGLVTPTISSPRDQSTNVATTVTLNWSQISGAGSYDILLGAVGSGCTAGAPVGTATTNSFSPPPLQPGTQYEWRVVARTTGCP